MGSEVTFAYYNEHDLTAAAWLRNLIAAGQIPDGEVDTRDIQDVEPADLKGFVQCHFFAGIGGWAYALQLAGWPPARPVWTGSCPCQPFSQAGRKHGTADERHVWPDWFQLIAESEITELLGEQVASPLGREWLAGVRAEMETLGYAVGAADLCAAGVGAPHMRQRLWWVAHRYAVRRAESVSGTENQDRPFYAQPKLHGGTAARTQGHGSTKRLPEYALQRCNRDVEGQPENRNEPQRDCGFERLEYRQQPGLEGHAGHGYRSHEPGRLDTDAHRPVAPAGGDGGMGNTADFDQGQRDTGSGIGQKVQTGKSGPRTNGFWDRFEYLPFRDGKTRRVEPGLEPLAHGVSGRVVVQRTSEQGEALEHWYSRGAALRGFGNAIVPQVAAAFVGAYMETT